MVSATLYCYGMAGPPLQYWTAWLSSKIFTTSFSEGVKGQGPLSWEIAEPKMILNAFTPPFLAICHCFYETKQRHRQPRYRSKEKNVHNDRNEITSVPMVDSQQYSKAFHFGHNINLNLIKLFYPACPEISLGCHKSVNTYNLHLLCLCWFFWRVSGLLLRWQWGDRSFWGNMNSTKATVCMYR